MPRHNGVEMSADPALIRALEERCFNAWPAQSSLLMQGWLVRCGDGFTGRANSASPLFPDRLPDHALIDAVSARFTAAGLKPTFRLTPLAPQGCAEHLIARGFAADKPSLVLHLPEITAAVPDARAQVTAMPTPDWIAGATHSYGDRADTLPALTKLLARMSLPAGYVTLRVHGVGAAFGLAVAERGMVGLFDLSVAPAHRRAGLGRALIDALLAYGRAQGASSAYLQVSAGNTVALALYESVGFKSVYPYTYFVRP